MANAGEIIRAWNKGEAEDSDDGMTLYTDGKDLFTHFYKIGTKINGKIEITDKRVYVDTITELGNQYRKKIADLKSKIKSKL